MLSVRLKIEGNSLRIYLDGIMHVSLLLDKLVGIQSYRFSPNRYCIEYVMSGNKIESWYDKEEVWMEILRELSYIELI